MELTDVQKQALTGWVREGMGLSDIQKRLSEEFGVSMTYMDVRFLVIDLNLSLQDKPEQKTDSGDIDAVGDVDPPDAPPAEQGLGGGVRVEIDRVQHPGTLVSGSVVFSDGVSALWALDTQRRFMLEPSQEGYQPSEADLQAFQAELQKALGGGGGF